MNTTEFQPYGRRPRYAMRLSEDVVYRTYRRHPIVFLRGIIAPLLLMLPVVLLLLAFGDASPAVAAVLLAVLVGLILWVGYSFLDWRADYLAVTDKRVLVNLERPGIQRELREVPLGKIQNIVTQRGGLVGHLIQNANLILDTSGLGRINFDDTFERDADEARQLILWLQKRSQQSALPSKEQYRQAVVRQMIYGGEKPQRPRQTTIISWPRSGFGAFNRLFPFRPQRDDRTVIWHKHWWFLIQAEAVPLLIIFTFEFTNILVALFGVLTGIDTSGILGVLALVRFPAYLLMLPVALWQWEDWRNDEYILTGDRLIDKEAFPFNLREEVKETELRRVTDATVTVSGVLPNLLRFGDVVIKTPGEATSFTFDKVPRPFDVQREIMQRLDAQREAEQAQWDRDIQEWLQTYIEERRAEPTPQAPPPPQNDGWNLGW